MNLLRVLLVSLLVIIAVYTVVVGLEHGWNFIPLFFEQIAALTWQGQFNLDFMTFLIMSALWCAWRSSFSLGGLFLALCASLGGMLFLSAYLLWLSYQYDGDIRRVLLGNHA